MYVRSMTIMLVEQAMLQEFRYLETGTFYSIFALAIDTFYSIFALAIDTFVQSLAHVPELLTGRPGIAFIDYAQHGT
ncbi:MAG: DUF475 domain-containing protein [Rhodobacteraceae bacterium]|nr:DUF475 domain-containing protein [Paracoccaceae bacterium]